MGAQARIFYTSDVHIGHRLVSGLRGFENTDDHDRTLGERWDEMVTEQDTVYVLGDISINGGDRALDWIMDRRGTKHLVSGNHDPVHPMHRTATKYLPKFLRAFDTVQPFLRRKLAGEDVLLSHFPYASWGDGQERPGSRYDQYRLPDMGLRLLHGHTHGQERAHGHSLHVGVDAWGLKPVPQEVVQSWVEGSDV